MVNLNEVCRACLNKKQNMKRLLNYNDDSHQLTCKLASLLHSEIQMNSQFPCFLCCECEEKLEMSFKFQQLCQQSLQFIIDCVAKLNVLSEDDNAKKYEISCTNDIVLKYENMVEEIPENEVSNDSNNMYFEQNVENDRKCNKQVMKLSQYPQEEVNSVIKIIKDKLLKQQKCLFCKFTANGSRSLSFHMGRLHREYKDTWCSKCNENVTNLSEHWESEHEDEFKCHFCRKNFNNTSHLIEHLSCHTVDRKYLCEVCNKCFISARHLKSHNKVHFHQKKYSCLVCSATVHTKRSLIKHLKIHKMHKCKVCDDSFDPQTYENHKCFMKSSEDSGKSVPEANTESEKQTNDPLKCGIEQESLHKPNSLQNENANDSEIKALCVYCGKKFRTRSKLSVHMRIHTGETPYQCSYCDARVTTRSHLVVHERTHTGEKPYVCDICGKRFAQSSVLSTHKKIHTGRTEQCSLCPKKFCRPSELKQHMRKHTGEKPFSCEYCNKAFIQRSHLVEHIWTHTDERRFKCKYCGKTFKQSSTLKSHLNIHSGKKSYQCSKCSYSSLENYSLQQHLLQHDQPNEDEISYRCEICDITFQDMAMFTSHCSTEHEMVTFSEGGKIDFVQDNDSVGNQQTKILQMSY